MNLEKITRCRGPGCGKKCRVAVAHKRDEFIAFCLNFMHLG